MIAVLALLRAQMRYWRRHRIQVVLALLGVSVGVAVFTAIRLANTGALDAFAEGVEAFAGRATHRVVSPAGGGVPESLYARLVFAPGVEAAAPLLRSRARYGARSSGAPGGMVTVIGADLASGGALVPGRPEAEDRPGGEGAIGGETMERLIGEPGTALASHPLARALGLEAGSRLDLIVGGREVPFIILGLFAPPEGRETVFERVLIVDPATFQETFGGQGRVDAIHLIVAPGSEAAVAAMLPAGLDLEPIGRRMERVAAMTASFRLNLESLGLFTLLVAIFLIFNAATFSVVQRRHALAIARCVGADGRAVLVALLAEAVVLGLAGGALGVILGRGLAQWIAGSTGATVFELFLLSEAPPMNVDLGAGLVAAGIALGVGATVLGAFAPALEGALVRPMAILRPESPRMGRAGGLAAWSLAGFAALGGGLLLVLPDRGHLVWGLVAATLIALGGAMLSPLALALVGRFGAPALGRLFGVPGRMAARQLARSLGRSGVAAASLTVALSLWLAIAVTVGSFRQTLELWLDQTLNADFYIAPLEETGEAATIAEPLLDGLRAIPGVRDVNVYRGRRVVIGERRVALMAIDIEVFSRNAHIPMDVPDSAAAFDLVTGGAVLISETLAYPLGLHTGEMLELPVPGGVRAVPIAAVVQDYSAPSGIVILDRRFYSEMYGPEPVNRAALWIEAGADPAARRARIRERIEALPGAEGLLVTPNAELRAEALRVFDRTFAVTALMRSLAAVVAFIAVVSAMMALLDERRRHLGFLRAIGLSRRKLGISLAIEAGLLACTAAVLSGGVGLAMSAVLVFVVNRRAFGWTLQFHPGEGPWLSLVPVALAAALLGSLYPIRQAGRLSIAATIREE